MMKILIVAVNYNSYQELGDYLLSMNKAAHGRNELYIDVFIADNSNGKEDIKDIQLDAINCKQFNYENLGYLGAASKVINGTPNISEYDYVAISNVDLAVSESFFDVLKKYNIADDVAWVAPQIYSFEENRDRNPKVLNRYTKKKLGLLYYMYKYPVLFYLYTATAYKRKKLAPNYDEMDIYAGHGSFMLLTRNFFKVVKRIDYPVFLFGEELFLAELVKNNGLRVRYVPTLRIEDNEHVSTSRMKKKFYFKCNKESIKYILDTFYE